MGEHTCFHHILTLVSIGLIPLSYSVLVQSMGEDEQYYLDTQRELSP